MKDDNPNRDRMTLKYVLGVVLAIAAVTALIISRQNFQKHDQDQPPASQSAATSNANKQTKDSAIACKIFTLADAKQLLGSTASGGNSNSNTSSKDLGVSICVYTQDSGTAAAPSVKTASLLVRTPNTDAGSKSNQSQFSKLKPADAQTVAGYGQDAYWDPQYSQLNILKDDTWYILTYGSPTPADRTLDQAKQMADTVIAKM